MSISHYSVLLSPVITEKSSFVGNGGNTVVFRIDTRATKEEVKNAIKTIYGKDAASVRVSNIIGKPKRRQSATGRSSRYRKAYVTLKEGQTIEVV